MIAKVAELLLVSGTVRNVSTVIVQVTATGTKLQKAPKNTLIKG